MIYLAAPLFTPAERAFNERIAWALEAFAPVFLPQRDGALLVDMVAAGVPLSVAEKRVFQQDCEAMRKAAILVAVLDGAHVDEGVAFEIGFMSAAGKPCAALQTDVRRALPTGNNPMVGGAMSAIFADLSELTAWVRTASAAPLLQDAKLAC
jgi:nucleoside 2-deoxyribosyltransferase